MHFTKLGKLLKKEFMLSVNRSALFKLKSRIFLHQVTVMTFSLITVSKNDPTSLELT